MSTLLFEVPKPFAFPQTVVSHGWYLLPPFRWDARRETLHRVEVLGGTAVDLKVRFKSTLQVTSATDLRPFEAVLRERLSRMFQLHIDLDDFVERCRLAATHQHIKPALCGRLLCAGSRFEDVVKIITTTNTTWAQTRRMNELLVEALGSKAVSGARAFPKPEQIASAPVELLRDCKLGYRALTIKAVATALAEGSLDLGSLADPQQSTLEMMKSFERLPGIGPYGSAHLVAMEGRFDFIAVDTEFRRFVRERYHRGRKVKDSTLLRNYGGWGKWKYLAYWSELWRTVAPQLEANGDE